MCFLATHHIWDNKAVICYLHLIGTDLMHARGCHTLISVPLRFSLFTSTPCVPFFTHTSFFFLFSILHYLFLSSLILFFLFSILYFPFLSSLILFFSFLPFLFSLLFVSLVFCALQAYLFSSLFNFTPLLSHLSYRSSLSSSFYPSCLSSPFPLSSFLPLPMPYQRSQNVSKQQVTRIHRFP